MDQLRFDGRVAIVTGAGGNPGLGRSYAMSLAARGARVVVNDLGTGPDGRGGLRTHAQAVVDEIVEAGGEAVADTSSVAEEESAQAVVRTAIDTWGKVDILINNAGVFHVGRFDEVSSSDIARIVQVHLFGNIWMCRAVWPFMTQQDYGRIVNISSAAAFGPSFQVAYGAAKAGIVGLTRALAAETRDSGINVNAFNPVAKTAGINHLFDEFKAPGLDDSQLDPDLVAPTVTYLAHQECSFSGSFISSGARHISEYVFSETVGYDSAENTPEDIRDNFAKVADRKGAQELPVPGSVPTPATLRPKPYQPA